jgi:signal transduction histidine kinase
MLKDRSLPLVLAFALIGTAFVSSTVYSELRAGAIDHQIAQTERNSLPSIEALGAARATLRELEVGAARYADVATRLEAEEVRAAGARLAGELARYSATPDYDEEAPLRSGATHAVASLDTAVGAMLEPGADARALYTWVHAEVAQTDIALVHLLKLNGDHLRAEVRQVSAMRRRTSETALVLDGLCVLMAVAATFISVRALRRQRAAEEAHERVLVERATELDMFAKRVAHDMLNPLSALTYHLELIKRTAARGESVAPTAAKAAACLQRTRRMVDGILDFARAGAPTAGEARASVRDAVEGVVAEAEAERAEGAEIVVEPFEDVDVRCAPGVLASVLANLVRNGLKYMKGRDEQKLTVRVGHAGGVAHVEVADTGPGLPAGFESRAFDPYVRAPDNPQPGLGLGLATVRRFVESHGGRVGVQSSPGHGAVFWFELPAT